MRLTSMTIFASRWPWRPRRAVAAAAVLAPLAATAVGADTSPRVGSTTSALSDGTVITVDTGLAADSARVHAELLGANHRWVRNGDGIWWPGADAPDAGILAKAQQVGLASARYPGGTAATLFNWKRAIGPMRSRECQYEGHYDGGRFGPAPAAEAFGPDEYMAFVEASDTTATIMETTVNQTAADAADWVEYMNHRLNNGNPNGGVNYARLRAANGHPRPYDVRRWEVGNEPYVGPHRYGNSRIPTVALRQYADGGTRTIRGEYLGKRCDHPLGGVRSDGRPRQSFRTLYRPVQRADFRLRVGGDPWRLVEDTGDSGPRAHVYTLNVATGTVNFGDGRHGAIPRRTHRVRASYSNPYDGFFAFARAMHAVDPSIDVCSSWGQEMFLRAAAGRRFDCLTTHAITGFPKLGASEWVSRIEGHDLLMNSLDDRRDELRVLQRSLRRHYPFGTPELGLSEVNAIHGDLQSWPHWRATISNAIFMANMWSIALNEGVPWATGGDLLGVSRGALIGDPPYRTLNAEAEVRQTVYPMLAAGGRTLGAAVAKNPSYEAAYSGVAVPYRGLQVSSTRDSRGRVWLLVVNKLPDTAVDTRIELAGYDARSTAKVFETSARGFSHWNRDGHEPKVSHVIYQLGEVGPASGASVADVTVAPNSVTVYRFLPRR